MLKKERIMMSNYFKNLFIGALMVFININIGFFDIVPDFIGYIIIFVALTNIYSKTNKKLFLYARNLSILNIIFSFIGLIYPMNYTINYYIPNSVLVLIFSKSIVDIVFMYIMYSGMLELVENIEEEFSTFIYRRGMAAVIGLLYLLNLSLIPVLEDSFITGSMSLLVFLLLIVNITYMVTLNKMKKLYLSDEMENEIITDQKYELC